MMRTLNDRELLAYAAKAVDPGTALAVEAALAVDPEARRRLAALSLTMDRLRGVSRWHLPQVPLPEHAPRLGVQLVAADFHDVGTGLRSGDHVGLRVPSPGDPASWKPVLVRETAGVSTVIYPVDADEWVTLDHWPVRGGAHEVDVVVDAPPGEHRYVLILAASPEHVDWTADPEGRWAAVRAQVEEGRLPAAVLRIEVEA